MKHLRFWLLSVPIVLFVMLQLFVVGGVAYTICNGLRSGWCIGELFLDGLADEADEYDKEWGK